jgi:hypothetical protein
LWEKEMNTNAFRLLMTLFAFWTAHPQKQQAGCGRVDWASVPYLYQPGEQVPDPRESKIVDIKILGGKSVITILNSASEQLHGFNNATYLSSPDGGRSWNPVADEVPSSLNAAPNLFVRSISALNVLYKFVSGLGLYIRSEDDGKSWVLPKYEIQGRSKDQWVEGMASRNYFLETYVIAVDPKVPNKLYASMRAVPWNNSALPIREFPSILVSRDGGDSWTVFSSDLSPFPPASSGTLIAPIGISPAKPTLMFGVSKKGVVKSLDGGTSWSPVGQEEELVRRPVYKLEQQHSERLLGAPSNLAVYQFAFDSTHLSIIYLVSNKGIFKTVDMGTSWRLLDLGFDEIDAVNSVAVDPIHHDEIYLGSRYGVFVSRDGGCHFDRIYPVTKNAQESEE